MSRTAIAAALARSDLSSGERLVAFSLASFADGENRARPGTPAAAGRAGLAKSRFLEARDQLVCRGLVVVQDAPRGRGRASTLALPFAETGPWWEGEINAELFETVLGYSRAKGSARLLVAALAALADQHGVVEALPAEQVCAVAGISDRTYRRAHAPLLSSGELVLCGSTGGRGNTNRWEIPDPRSHTAATRSAPRRRVAPRPGARPLMTTVVARPIDEQLAIDLHESTHSDRIDRAVGAGKGGQNRTASPEKGPDLTGVSGVKGGQNRTLSAQKGPALSGVSELNPGQVRTLLPETPAKTPAETPAPYARAGSEPQNPRTLHPPNPPEGGSDERLFVEETYLTERGRRRRRVVAVDVASVRARLGAAGEGDLAAWERVRGVVREAVGESTFEIWLEGMELIAIDVDGSLVVAAPPPTRGWVARRFGRVLEEASARAGRGLRIASEVERKALDALGPSGAAGGAGPASGSLAATAAGRRVGAAGGEPGGPARQADLPGGVPADTPRAVRGDRSAGAQVCEQGYRSADPSSYGDVYKQTREVS